ncbi:MAG TPA: ATP-binding protein [Candidatus Limnocylindria bacterium]|nr:ATP-binding protein [Candidatus Limnocylindria bacterium]
MTIRRKLKILSWLMVFMGAVFGTSIHIDLKKYQSSFSQAKTANLIATSVFQRRLVADDYLLHSGTRAKQQWYLQQSVLEKIVENSKNEFTSAEKQSLLASIEDDALVSSRIFDQLTADNSVEKQKLLIGELTVKEQETVLAATKLADINIQETSGALNNIIFVFSVAASLFFLTLFFCFWIIWRSASRLEREEAKDNAILGSIGDAVFAIDTTGKIILFNRAASQISGFGQNEALGSSYNTILKFVEEKTQSPSVNFIQNALNGQQAHMDNHTALVTKSGGLVPVADTASPLLNSNGKADGAVVVFRDVRKDREIDKAKDEFISLASHQLRTPLTAIRLYSEILADKATGKLNEKQAEYLEIVHESTVRMIKLVGDILNVSRIQLGSLKIEPKPTRLQDLAQSIIEEIKPVALEKKIVIKLETQQILPEVNIDESLMRQVIHNLITNAVRYSNEGGKIEVTLQKTSAGQEPQGYLICVKDSGIGIPKEAQAKIFTRFFRADNAVRKAGEGTGLGMYMAKMVVETTGGKIWFDSKENQGTSFYVIIPKEGMAKKEGSKSLS